MAGSLHHIVAEDGRFQMELIENLGDAHEALAECHQIIAWFSREHPGELQQACDAMNHAMPEAEPAVASQVERDAFLEYDTGAPQ